MRKALILFYILICSGLSFSISYASQDIKILVKQPDTQLSYNVIEEGKVLLSIKDSRGEPVRGLNPVDFAVGRGIQRADILSAESLESTKEIPLNIVLVIDNSFSMKERQAVEPLLLALDEFFQTVRPIDNIHLVVFDDKPRVMVRETPLHPGHLRLMLQAAETGAIIAPAIPAFYHKPRNIEDIINQSIGRILDILDIQVTGLFHEWSGNGIRV